jgi:hypothetical protein
MNLMLHEMQTALPTGRAGRSWCGTAYRVMNLCMLVVVAVVLIAPTGCDETDDGEVMQRLLDAERARCDRLVASLRSDLARQEAEMRGAETDYQGAVLIWGGTAAALFIAILLLARERRGRRVLDRLLQMIPHRGDPSRSADREP